VVKLVLGSAEIETIYCNFLGGSIALSASIIISVGTTIEQGATVKITCKKPSGNSEVTASEVVRQVKCTEVIAMLSEPWKIGGEDKIGLKDCPTILRLAKAANIKLGNPPQFEISMLEGAEMLRSLFKLDENTKLDNRFEVHSLIREAEAALAEEDSLIEKVALLAKLGFLKEEVQPAASPSSSPAASSTNLHVASRAAPPASSPAAVHEGNLNDRNKIWSQIRMPILQSQSSSTESGFDKWYKQKKQHAHTPEAYKKVVDKALKVAQNKEETAINREAVKSIKAAVKSAIKHTVNRDDDFHSPACVQRFIDLRLNPKAKLSPRPCPRQKSPAQPALNYPAIAQVAFYKKRLPEYSNINYALRSLLVLGGCVAAVLAYTENTAWAVVLTTIAAAITSWSEFSDVSRKTERYNRALVELANLLSGWFNRMC
jgi:hypothetical protein